MTATKTAEYEIIPPDGGWGWMVVLGVALNYMTSQALISVFSVLFGQKLISMGHETTSAAVIMNVMTAVMNFSGLLTGPLLKKFSMRQVAVTGGCFVVTGLVLTSFANSIIHIIITYSIFVAKRVVDPAGSVLSAPILVADLVTLAAKQEGGNIMVECEMTLLWKLAAPGILPTV
ncbi:monocarboxylate transporter 1-like [Schistocerca cancellata]|uniref:monocarboxylate transporter 1-like n=1 Tax=Schistocerca cancellata TaxID=274614 RepID=UPI0021194A77|nr:monocarboxylate transporter 1-like [Schistocerca cancellata]